MSLTRRAFVASAAALPTALRSLAQQREAPRWVFLGTADGPGILRCSWDGATGRLGEPVLAVATPLPQFLALHPTQDRLYTVNAGMGAEATVSSFHLDRAAGTLTFADRQSSLGDGPCYFSVLPGATMAFVANYAGGSLTTYALAQDGALGPPASVLDCRHNPQCGTQGTVNSPPSAAHLHSATFSPDGYFLLVCNLGNDNIEVFPIDPEVGTAGSYPLVRSPVRIATRPGSGPRHLAFHPGSRWVYVTHEVDCTVELFDWEGRPLRSARLRRRAGSAVSLLSPGEPRAGSTGCEIIMSSNGQFVYTCTRGADSLQVFRIDQGTGMLTRQQTISCGGKVPQHIALDPTERWLLCANQGGRCVTVFANDARSGRLKGPVQTVAVPAPMFVQFA